MCSRRLGPRRPQAAGCCSYEHSPLECRFHWDETHTSTGHNRFSLACQSLHVHPRWTRKCRILGLGQCRAKFDSKAKKAASLLAATKVRTTPPPFHAIVPMAAATRDGRHDAIHQDFNQLAKIVRRPGHLTDTRIASSAPDEGWGGVGCWAGGRRDAAARGKGQGRRAGAERIGKSVGGG